MNILTNVAIYIKTKQFIFLIHLTKHIYSINSNISQKYENKEYIIEKLRDPGIKGTDPVPSLPLP